MTQIQLRSEIQKGTKYQSMCDSIELRAIKDESGENKMRFEGYAIVFNKATTLYRYNGVDYKEIIDSKALKNTDMKDVPLRYNHETSWVLARTRKKSGPGSLVLQIDEKGLKVSGEFVDMQYSRDVYAMMAADVVNQMSFAFTVRESAYNTETHTTTIKDIDKLFDVSVVDSPAYPQTSISACRCAEEAEMEIKAKQEAKALEKAKAEAEANKVELENQRKAELEKLNNQIALDELKEQLENKEDNK